VVSIAKVIVSSIHLYHHIRRKSSECTKVLCRSFYPKTTDIQQLCMDFKAKADGTTINTKLCQAGNKEMEDQRYHLPRPQVNNTRRRGQSQKTPAPTIISIYTATECTRTDPTCSSILPSLAYRISNSGSNTQQHRTRNCCWFPFFGAAIICGGLRKNSCSKFGVNGTHIQYLLSGIVPKYEEISGGFFLKLSQVF